eukprot:1061797-Amorphochlora_amoeboformis.AAC.2
MEERCRISTGWSTPTLQQTISAEFRFPRVGKKGFRPPLTPVSWIPRSYDKGNCCWPEEEDPTRYGAAIDGYG